jgi:predicted enzyme related to lactoylglutathione lyase
LCGYELVTNDIQKALTFYKKVVGWEVRDSGMPGPPYMIFGMDGKDVGGMMTWAGTGATGALTPQWMGHIHTSDLDAELKAVSADGGTILKPAQVIPTVGRFAVVNDPQGVMYLLFEPGQTTAPPRLGQHAPGNVGWHELLTDDAAKAFDYYSKHYGWTKDYAHDMGPMGVYQTFGMGLPVYSGGMMNRKAPGMPPGIPAHWQYYFNVDDVDAAHKRVEAAGGKTVMPPMDVPGGSRIMQGIDDQGGHFALTHAPKT